MEEFVAQRNGRSVCRKGQLTQKERKQLLVWGGLFFITLVFLVYLFVRLHGLVPEI
jgi:hypothetical protein